MATKISKSLSAQLMLSPSVIFMPGLMLGWLLMGCAHSPPSGKTYVGQYTGQSGGETASSFVDPKEERMQTMSDRLADQEAEIANLKEAARRLEAKIKKISEKYSAPPLLDAGVPVKKLHPQSLAQTLAKTHPRHLSDGAYSARGGSRKSPVEEFADGDDEFGYEGTHLATEIPESNGAQSVADSRHEPMHFYYLGLEQLKVRDGEGAVKAFTDFINHAPDHPYADRAQYWISEAYRRNAEWERAVVASNVLESKYPYSFKIPDGLLTRAECLEKMGNREEARRTLKDLMTRFPSSPSFDEASRRLSVLTISDTQKKSTPVEPVVIDD